jgi:hypothetical protein
MSDVFPSQFNPNANSKPVKKTCNCERCKLGEAVFEEKRQKLLKEYGFTINFVEDDEKSPTFYNICSSGLPESFNHKEIQIVLPLPKETAAQLFHTIVNRIKKGEKFAPNIKYDKIIENWDVMFIDVKYYDSNILRLILPDRHGNLERNIMEEGISVQYLV